MPYYAHYNLSCLQAIFQFFCLCLAFDPTTLDIDERNREGQRKKCDHGFLFNDFNRNSFLFLDILLRFSLEN